MPRGVENIPAQWFEKYGLLGWEKVMFVFGYADIFTVCMHLIEMAKSDSPDDYFRCSDAN